MPKRAKPGAQKSSQGWHRLLYWAMLGAGLAISLVPYTYFKYQLHQRVEAQLDQCAEDHRAQLLAEVERYERQLNSLKVLFDYSASVSRDTFQGASRSLRENQQEYPLLEWIPRVAASQREAYEKEARQQDFPDFEFKERNAQGNLATAGIREEYWPIYYLEPFNNNQEALGYDLINGPTAALLARARDTGETVSTGLIPLIQESIFTNGWIIIKPIYRSKFLPQTVDSRREHFRGFLQSVFRVEELCGNTWNRNVYANFVDILVLDTTSGEVSRPIFARSPHPSTAGIADIVVRDFREHAARATEATLLGRTWKILITPHSGWFSRQSDWSAEAFLSAGLLLVGLGAANLFRQQRRAAAVERLVAVKTAQWRQVNQELQRQIEERRKTRSELEASQQNRLRLAAAVDQTSEMVAFCDAGGLVRYVNPAFLRATGLTEGDILGYPLPLSPESQPPGTWFAEAAPLAAQVGNWRGSFLARNKNGSAFDVEVAISPVRDPSINVAHYIVLARDVTNERQLEEQVRMSQKMEAIGLLAGGVAHDFNNLLQVIQGYASLAAGQLGNPAELKESLDQVLGASDRAARLTRQLLAFGRRQALQKEDLDLGVLISDLLLMIRRIIGEHIEISLQPVLQLANVRADRSQIEQVVLNLCVNARDAMANGGRLSIELSNVLLNGQHRENHPGAKPGPYVLMRISDTGVGMNKETLRRIFEPFFSTKSKEHGTGLGLSVVYGIVQQHDGLVEVQSEPGRGATFCVYLPASERRSPPTHVTPHPAPSRGHETILLVEDEVAVRTLAAKVLERAGYQVFLAADGLEACEVFKQNADAIHLVLLDVVMPRMGGRAAYEKISALRPGVPVIYCSGYSEQALQGGFELPRHVRLIQKPYVPNELLNCIRNVLDGN